LFRAGIGFPKFPKEKMSKFKNCVDLNLIESENEEDCFDIFKLEPSKQKNTIKKWKSIT
jgi:hypothetical protein